VEYHIIALLEIYC